MFFFYLGGCRLLILIYCVKSNLNIRIKDIFSRLWCKFKFNNLQLNKRLWCYCFHMWCIRPFLSLLSSVKFQLNRKEPSIPHIEAEKEVKLAKKRRRGDEEANRTSVKWPTWRRLFQHWQKLNSLFLEPYSRNLKLCFKKIWTWLSESFSLVTK